MSSVKEIQSVRNACRVLEAIARTQPVGVSDLARAVGIDKSAAHRLAITLHAAGWVDRLAKPGQIQPGRNPPHLTESNQAIGMAPAAYEVTDRGRLEPGGRGLQHASPASALAGHGRRRQPRIPGRRSAATGTTQHLAFGQAHGSARRR